MVKDGDGSVLMNKACGYTVPQPITSHTNKVEITFHSDRSVTRKGFKIDWRATESK